MLKMSSKRRRTRKQIAAEKEAKANQDADLQAKLAFVAESEVKLAHYDQMAQNYEGAHAILTQLKDQGLIDVDEHGNASPSKRKP